MENIKNIGNAAGYHLQQAAIPFSIGTLSGYAIGFIAPLRLGAMSGLTQITYELFKELLAKQSFTTEYIRKITDFKYGIYVLKAGGYLAAGAFANGMAVILGAPLTPVGVLVAAAAALIGQLANEKLGQYLLEKLNPQNDYLNKREAEIARRERDLESGSQSLQKEKRDFKEQTLGYERLKKQIEQENNELNERRIQYAKDFKKLESDKTDLAEEKARFERSKLV